MNSYFYKEQTKEIDFNSSPILVTGAAGFIGSSLVIKLLEQGKFVIGIDNLNNYYSKDLKIARLNEIKKVKNLSGNWKFFENDIQDFSEIKKIFKLYKPKLVFNLAAQAGVRYSIKEPSTYLNSNLLGFGNILELCRLQKVKNLVFASSSSVYGSNSKLPFNEDDCVDHPISLYAATKKSNEMMAHAYSHLFNMPITGLRYFTVYGPWGRPDMAPMIFTKSILENKEIEVFNNGEMMRDFTYIDDVVDCTIKCGFKPAQKDINFNQLKPNPSTSKAPYRIFNVGNNKPVELLKFINLLEDELGIKAKKNYKPMQMGDVKKTYADIYKVYKWVNFKPTTNLKEGICNFINWYRNYYK